MCVCPFHAYIHSLLQRQDLLSLLCQGQIKSLTSQLEASSQCVLIIIFLCKSKVKSIRIFIDFDDSHWFLKSN